MVLYDTFGDVAAALNGKFTKLPYCRFAAMVCSRIVCFKYARYVCTYATLLYLCPASEVTYDVCTPCPCPSRGRAARSRQFRAFISVLYLILRSSRPLLSQPNAREYVFVTYRRRPSATIESRVRCA